MRVLNYVSTWNNRFQPPITIRVRNEIRKVSSMIVEHLIADVFGSHLGKYSERLKVTKGKETLAQAPLLHLRSVTINSRGVSISADALEACCERGIPIFFLDSIGEN